MVQKLLQSIVLFSLLIFGIFQWNRNQIKIRPDEIELLVNFFGKKLNINNKSDLIIFQNTLIDTIKHDFNQNETLDLNTILSAKKGLCFEKSFIIQKVLSYNNIKFRPIYIFYSGESSTNYFNLFDKYLHSHAGVEVYFEGKWYYIDSNTKQSALLSFSDFVSIYKTVPKHVKSVRYLSNRHGKFIFPFFLPDIY